MNIDKYLSPTEKEKSEITKVTSNGVMFDIYRKTRDSQDKGNDKIVRILVNDNFIVKLQTFDNGTPFIYVFNETNDVMNSIKNYMKDVCDYFGIVYSEVKVFK